jgi:CMP-N-acetylneuraminic acid synthetase
LNIAFVPVRGGSKSIPHKNIKSFCGKPLVYWCLNALNESNNIDKIFVATDCEIIKQTVQSFKLSKVCIFDRSNENAKDHSSTESVLLEFLNKNSFGSNDLIFLIQATSPLTQTSDIDNAFQLLLDRKTDSLLSCVRFKRFLWDELGFPINYKLNKRPRRQDFRGELLENGAVYISSVSNILRSRNRISGSISIYEMDDSSAIEIDEEDDWPMAEYLMKKRLLAK